MIRFCNNLLFSLNRKEDIHLRYYNLVDDHWYCYNIEYE